jgi:hypothetical protein
MNTTRSLFLALIHPSRYDDDGFVIRYFRGVFPSNTLACMRSLTLEFAERWKTERGISVELESYDEMVEHIPIGSLARRNRGNTKVVAALVGVQSNQFVRASDLAKSLSSQGIKTLIGGFHVSGVISMFGEPTKEIRELMDCGVTVVHGEAENRWESILADVVEGREKQLYVMEGYPDITNQPLPQPGLRYMKKFAFTTMGTVDCSRGCPFNCSFCTVVNVQGRTMRNRSAECLLASFRSNHERGIDSYFFTDDNFSRNPEWEKILDGLIRMRETDGIHISFIIQVDTRSHKLPNFTDKVSRAGCSQVFIGMESLNPKNLEAAGKNQNRVEDYEEFIRTWHAVGVATHVGYIIGFPYDTPESVRCDIDRLKKEIKVDIASFFMLTPLPGSRDHFEMIRSGRHSDPDLNKYDSFHVVQEHPLMTGGEWMSSYNDAWASFYSFDNLRSILMRTGKAQYWTLFTTMMWYRNSLLEPRHPMITGFVRKKSRRDVRSGTPIPGFWSFHFRHASELFSGFRKRVDLFFELQELWLLTRKPDDPAFRFVADFTNAVNEAKSRLSSIELSAPYAKWGEEMNAAIATFREKLALQFNPSMLTGKARKRVQKLFREMNEYLETVNPGEYYQQGVSSLTTYLTKNREAIENCSLSLVARRRKITRFWHESFDRVKEGKMIRFLISLPRCGINFVQDFRITASFMYHLFSRNPVRQR